MGIAEGTAVNGPLFVAPDLKEGQLFYNSYLESVPSADSDEPTLEARPFPRPIVHFPLPLGCRNFAVSDGSILGLRSYCRDTFVYDAVTQATVPGPQLRDYKVRIALLPVGDYTVLVMDMILRMPWPGDSFCSFETLRPLPAGGGWRAMPLPEPPIGYGPLLVTAYLALGARVWISVKDRGTFSLDVEQDTWRMEGSWELPLLGRAFYVPELGSVFGLSTVGGSYLCACDIEARPRPVLVRLWSETFSSSECREAGHKLWWDMTSLAYLGEGRFCIPRHVVVERAPEGRAAQYTISCRTVEVRRLPGGELS